MRRSNGAAVTMSKEDDMTDVPDAPVAELDLRRIGEILTKLPAVAAYLRHESVTGTLDYVWRDASIPEREFIRDILTEPLDVVLDRWYGGHLHATTLAAGVMDFVLQELRR
jgi:hypothetical protein